MKNKKKYGEQKDEFTVSGNQAFIALSDPTLKAIKNGEITNFVIDGTNGKSMTFSMMSFKRYQKLKTQALEKIGIENE